MCVLGLYVYKITMEYEVRSLSAVSCHLVSSVFMLLNDPGSEIQEVKEQRNESTGGYVFGERQQAGQTGTYAVHCYGHSKLLSIHTYCTLYKPQCNMSAH